MGDMEKLPNGRNKKRERVGRSILAAVFSVFFLCRVCSANNLNIGNVKVEDPDSASGTITLVFDMSWENSWRNSVNHDAVWVFVKYTRDMGLTWEHATLEQAGKDPAGTWPGIGATLEIVVPEDRKGGFFRRSSTGAGKIGTTGARLAWNWRKDGLSAEDEVGVRVIGIEMVYVPAGAFYVGDGDGVSASTYAFRVEGEVLPVEISAGSVMVSSLPSPNDDIDATPVRVSGAGGVEGNENFPTGYRAFYAMKYEITEGQWVDFFNMIPQEAKDRRDITGPGGKNSNGTVNRNTVSRNMALAATSRPDRSCGYLSWQDIAAYFDWAALRPMTELEFEKVARGAGSSAIKGEYAWGSGPAETATAISGFEGGSEIAGNEGANVCFGNKTFSGGDGGQGPLRAGIFATSRSTRENAGAGYYGMMELSGNVWERTVSLGRVEGRDFQGTHGDGVLGTEEGHEGNATNTDWPGYMPGEGVSGAAGSGFRGGSWMEAGAESLRISDRSRASTTSTARLPDAGGRGARTDPGF
jgi:formylglycine-generating enzyme required for sulfatase activity